MLIVATHVTQQTNDKQQIEPAIEMLEQLPEQLVQVKEIIADAGYFSKSNVEACEDADIERRLEGIAPPLSLPNASLMSWPDGRFLGV
ncbi:MAG: hypothetical protein ACOYLR_09280 [Chlorobium sp.]